MKVRIKEVILKSDGSNTWFYPQFYIVTKKIIGKLWRKKEIEEGEWKCFYKHGDGFEVYNT